MNIGLPITLLNGTCPDQNISQRQISLISITPDWLSGHLALSDFAYETIDTSHISFPNWGWLSYGPKGYVFQ